MTSIKDAELAKLLSKGMNNDSSYHKNKLDKINNFLDILEKEISELENDLGSNLNYFRMLKEQR